MNYLNQIIKKFAKVNILNERVVRQIINYQEQGISYRVIKERLKIPYNTIREFTISYAKLNAEQYDGLLSFLNDHQILAMYNETRKIRREILNKCLQTLIYPLLCTTTSCVVAIFSILVLIPNIEGFSSLSTSNTLNVDIVYKVMLILNITVKGMLLMLLFSLSIWGIKHQNRLLIITVLKKYFKLQLLNEYYSLTHSVVLSYYVRNGISTLEVIKSIRHHSNSLLQRWHAFSIQEKLDSGINLIEAYRHDLLDSDLLMYIELGVRSNNLLDHLMKYIHFSEKKIYERLNKVLNSLKIASFIDIGLLIVVVFQLVSYPMELLTHL